MAIHMAENIKQERLRWVEPIEKGQTNITEVMKVFPYGKRTLERWLAAYRYGGEEALEPKSTRPKTSPKETPIRIKETVIELRRKTKKCALKLKWKLGKRGISLHERTIGKIIKAEGLTRKYRTKKIQYRYVKAALKPGALFEMDVKYVPQYIEEKRYFQYTAIDVATRWRYLAVFEEESIQNAIAFLAETMTLFGRRIYAVKTDNHATFTNRYNGTYRREDLSSKKIHALDQFCTDHGIIHYLIDPGKPSQNGTIERSHRSDQQTFYDENTFSSFKDLQKKLKSWNIEYNDLEHCGLDGKSPNEALAEFYKS